MCLVFHCRFTSKRKNPVSPSSDSEAERLPQGGVLSPPSKRRVVLMNARVKDSLPEEDYNDAVAEIKREYRSSRMDENHMAELIEVNVESFGVDERDNLAPFN